MTKDVLVKISGMQYDVADEPIELVVEGTHYIKNGKHYVLYEEQPEADGLITKNIVRFNENSFEMTKKGGNNSYLKFEKNVNTSSVYQTPVGPLQIDVFAKKFEISETDREIKIRIRYSLDINCEFVSECEVLFSIHSRGPKLSGV